MPEPIVTLNEEDLKTDLRELVRGTAKDTEQPARQGGRRPGRREALRKDRGKGGLSRQALRAQARDDVRRGHHPHAQA